MCSIRRLLVLLLATVVPTLLLGCATYGKDTSASVEIKLDIPDRRWDPDRPDKRVGWCAEACIQMAMEYYGKEVSQQAISQAGSPDHPDLYVYDIDEALNTIGVSYMAWNESNPDLLVFVTWIKEQLLSGYPVLCGVKIYPDKNPNWYLDHFVLAVGFNEYGLILNTQLDMDGQSLISYTQLSSENIGYSFKNSKNHYFARAITGLR